ncbi:MAG: hypothetical protein H7831_16245 [Magnetococcus sp. WYHC-3]
MEMQNEKPIPVEDGEILPYEITVKWIVEKFLKEQGCDSLYDETSDCGCSLGNLMPCDSPVDRCRPGYLCKANGLVYPEKHEKPPGETI